jgi:hypothetical protein
MFSPIRGMTPDRLTLLRLTLERRGLFGNPLSFGHEPCLAASVGGEPG